MMAELAPPGFDNMVRRAAPAPPLPLIASGLTAAQFFGLFGLSNRASSLVGPNVVQAIIDNTGSNWMGFPFLFALCAAASLTIWFAVDVDKGSSLPFLHDPLLCSL
jgi:hypothetical protein